MCGIAGVFSHNYGKIESTIFAELMHLSVLRGEDSTGIAAIQKEVGGDNPYSTVVLKDAVPSPVFMYLDQDVQETIYEKLGLKAGLFGHCRFATKGTISAKNAHPFRFSKITGVHNGTISKFFKGSRQFETDSEAVFKLINDEGIDKTIAEIDGSTSAYSLGWFDVTDQRMYFIRNGDRPLWFSYFYGEQSLMFASEGWMLDVVGKRHSVHRNTHDLLKYKEGEKKLKAFTLHPNTLFSFPVNEPKKYELRTITLPKPKTFSALGMEYWRQKNNNVVKEEYNPLTNTFTYHKEDIDPNHEEPKSKNQTKREARKAEKLAKRKGKKSNIIEPSGKDCVMVQGHKGFRYPFSEIQTLCSDGCAFCRKEIICEDPEDAKKIEWYDSEEPICEACQSLQHIKEFITGKSILN